MAKETQPVRVTDGHSSIWAIPAGAWEESTWSTRSEASMNDVDADEHPQMMGPVRIDPKGGPSTGPGPGRHLVTAHPVRGPSRPRTSTSRPARGRSRRSRPRLSSCAVSYTHLTLPTKRIV